VDSPCSVVSSPRVNSSSGYGTWDPVPVRLRDVGSGPRPTPAAMRAGPSQRLPSGPEGFGRLRPGWLGGPARTTGRITTGHSETILYVREECAGVRPNGRPRGPARRPPGEARSRACDRHGRGPRRGAGDRA
jgi:hypothetical protein